MTDNKRQEEKERFYSPENIEKEESELSPSGKYRLVIRYYKTGKDTWNYSEGSVYRNNTSEVEVEQEDHLVARVRRNYSSFNHAFIITPSNEEYLITGRTYMGLTIVNLESGKEWNYNPPSGEEDLCSTSFELAKDGKTLIICGCFWGGPYSYYFYDFDLDRFDTNKGLPSLIITDNTSTDTEGIDLSAMKEDWYIETGSAVELGISKEIEEVGDSHDNRKVEEKEDIYFLYRQKEEYNTKYRKWQQDIEDDNDVWLEMAPLDLKPRVEEYILKWPKGEKRTDRFEEWWNDYRSISDALESHFERDCILVVAEQIILVRRGDCMEVISHLVFDEKIGMLVSK